MKNFKMKLCTVAILCITANSAFASQGSLELKVKGVMAAPTCEIKFASDNGVINLGKISVSNIKENSATKLPVPSAIAINAICDAEVPLSFSVVDNRASTVSSPSPKHFGLGAINGDGKIGYYGIKMNNGYVDAKETSVYSSMSSTAFTSSKEVDVEVGNVMGWAGSDNQPKAGKQFLAMIQVVPYLGSSKDMAGPVPEGSEIDGSATLSFSYAI